MSSDNGAGDPVDRRTLVGELVAAQAVADEPISTVVLLERLCRAAAEHLGAAGVAVGLMSDSGSEGVVASADERSSLLDELQFTLGEGPSHHAFRMRRPVLISDLESSEGDAWPAYRAAALEAGVSGVFAFPLHVGAATFGVLTIHLPNAGPLDNQRLAMALTFAESGVEILLNADTISPDGSPHPAVEIALGHRAGIYQAQGWITVTLGVTLAEAMVRMRGHAFANDQSLAELAALILSGDVVLDS